MYSHRHQPASDTCSLAAVPSTPFCEPVLTGPGPLLLSDPGLALPSAHAHCASCPLPAAGCLARFAACRPVRSIRQLARSSALCRPLSRLAHLRLGSSCVCIRIACRRLSSFLHSFLSSFPEGLKCAVWGACHCIQTLTGAVRQDRGIAAFQPAWLTGHLAHDQAQSSACMWIPGNLQQMGVPHASPLVWLPS